MNNQLEQQTRDVHDAFSNNQFDKVLESVSDNVEVNSYGFGMSFHNKEGFSNFMQGFKSAFPDVRLEHTNIVSNGNTVAVEFIVRGTHTGALETPNGSIPPTGKSIQLTASEFITWDNGKIVRINNYQDGATMMRQLGIM